MWVRSWCFQLKPRKDPKPAEGLAREPTNDSPAPVESWDDHSLNQHLTTASQETLSQNHRAKSIPILDPHELWANKGWLFSASVLEGNLPRSSTCTDTSTNGHQNHLNNKWIKCGFLGPTRGDFICRCAPKSFLSAILGESELSKFLLKSTFLE